MDNNSSERNPIDVLAEEFATRCREGAHPSIEEYAAKYPHHAADIRSLFPPVAMIEELKRRKKVTTVRGVPPPAADAPALQQLGDFRIIRELGRGGMGIVYEAHQATLDRRVALKVLPRHSLLDANRLQRFQREAQAAAQLHHTNIVPVFGSGECDGLHYYVMQIIEGKPLNRIIDRYRGKKAPVRPGTVILHPNVPPAPSGHAYWRWVANIGVQIAEAIGHAHKQGTLHRDVKPANIILDLHGTAWVTDFGLAKLAEAEDLTRSGDIVGTLQYMAPESFNGQSDERSDGYSIGLTLYELLTLRPPFAESTAAGLIREMSENDPVPPRKVNKDIPRDLETIVMKASARMPEQRYPNAAELADDLRRFIDDRPVLARAVGPAERLLRWGRRNRAIAGLGAGVIASLLLALIVGWVGYVQTTAALERESQRRADAIAATNRAEENVRMSLQAFEEIFNQLEPADPMAPLDPPPFGPNARPGNPGGQPGPQRRESKENLVLLQSVLTFYDRFAEKNATNSSLQFEVAKAYRRVGEIQQRLGDIENAEAANRRAMAIVRNLQSAYSKSREHQELTARLHSQLGSVLLRRSDFAEGDENHRKAVVMLSGLAEQNPGDERFRVDLAHARLARAVYLLKQKQLPEARAQLEESLAAFEPVVQANPRFRPLLGMHYGHLGEVQRLLGNPDEAFKATQEAQRLLPKMPRGPRPNGPNGPDDREPRFDEGPPPRRDENGPERPRRPNPI